MIRRLLVAATLACTLHAPAWAAPADFGPPDGWAQQRAKLEAQRRDPLVACLLNAMIPGMGTAYGGEFVKGVIQAGGALGVWIGSQLISTGVFALTQNREAALFFSYAPYPAYASYAAVDGYMSTVIVNERVNHQLEAITPIGFRLQVAQF
jgi:hypothetical protein